MSLIIFNILKIKKQQKINTLYDKIRKLGNFNKTHNYKKSS
ncbi:hypothetical protein KU06062659_710004 [Flavobacterium psychrophilum]|nr:hypothetical protein FPC831_280013 [Flavobacterium psychrophilum]SNB06784.1 hypothetical protein KU06112801_1540004 [Flavobacterium psychrophilum]SNB13704.1 hypothetical protein JIP1600_2280005 [Flavobacterium psychrophilum]SNB21401.1 hypothetical protein KU06062659_710004 [Flavobacterium psychrophilum]